MVRRRKKTKKQKIPLEATDPKAVPDGLRILARMIARSLYEESSIPEINIFGKGQSSEERQDNPER